MLVNALAWKVPSAELTGSDQKALPVGPAAYGTLCFTQILGHPVPRMA